MSSGMDASTSTHPALDPAHVDDEPPPVGHGNGARSHHAPVAARTPAAKRKSAHWTRRAARTTGFHLLALAGFTVPAVVLWWHVWSGHPTSMLTCSCGDPAQQVWFTAWPAYAIAHLHNPFFSGSVNVPDGANLLSNTSGTLVGIVLAPITWTLGPVAATNVALTLAPALSAWGCFVAVRSFVTWKAAAIPAALVYGYSSAMVSSLVFGHVSLAVLVVPPLLFGLLHEIVIRQEHSVRRDALALAALLVVQFLISPEVLVMCGVLGVVGLVLTAVVGWRQVRARSGHALRALGVALGVTAVVLCYPVWFGLAGPEAVTGVLFALAPLSGVPFSGLFAAGAYGAPAAEYVHFGGYLGHNGPPTDYVGAGVGAAAVASLVVARRRLLTWLLLLLAFVSFWLALGVVVTGGPVWLDHAWYPWSQLVRLPPLEEILPDQFAPFITLLLAFLIAVGLDAVFTAHRAPGSWMERHRVFVTAAATGAVAVTAVLPVWATFDVPLRVESVTVPAYMRQQATQLPVGTVLLTVPFAVSGSTRPMWWQAADAMRFRLAGAALKTPDAQGGPIGQGAPGSARRILTDLTVLGTPLPAGTPAQIGALRAAIAHWQVGRVVITGASRDPVYASGLLTEVLGAGPSFVDGAYVWTLQPGVLPGAAARGGQLSACRAQAAAPEARGHPLSMARCVMSKAGRVWVQA